MLISLNKALCLYDISSHLRGKLFVKLKHVSRTAEDTSGGRSEAREWRDSRKPYP